MSSGDDSCLTVECRWRLPVSSMANGSEPPADVQLVQANLTPVKHLAAEPPTAVRAGSGACGEGAGPAAEGAGSGAGGDGTGGGTADSTSDGAGAGCTCADAGTSVGASAEIASLQVRVRAGLGSGSGSGLGLWLRRTLAESLTLSRTLTGRPQHDEDDAGLALS